MHARPMSEEGKASPFQEDEDNQYFSYLDQHGDLLDDDDNECSVDGIPDVVEEDCGPDFDAVTGVARASDQDLRHYAFTQPMCEVAEAKCYSGNRGKCKFGGKCCSRMEVEEVWEMRKSFWKFDDDK